MKNSLSTERDYFKRYISGLYSAIKARDYESFVKKSLYLVNQRNPKRIAKNAALMFVVSTPLGIAYLSTVFSYRTARRIYKMRKNRLEKPNSLETTIISPDLPNQE